MFTMVMFPRQYFYLMPSILCIQDIEITNSAENSDRRNIMCTADKMERTGVAVAAREKGVRSGIHTAKS